MMLKGSFSFSLMALCVKIASSHIPSMEIVFLRSLIGVIMISTLMKIKKTSFFGRERSLLLFRGITGFFALLLYFYAISKLPIGTAVMLNYTAPILAAIIAMIFLKEKKSLFVIVMAVTAFCGVYMLVETNIGTWNQPVIAGLVSAVFAALAYVFIRAIKHRESPLTVIFYFTAVSTLGSLFFVRHFIWPDIHTWLILVGVGICSFYGQLWMTISLRRARASLVSPFSYFTPLLTFLYG